MRELRLEKEGKKFVKLDTCDTCAVAVVLVAVVTCRVQKRAESEMSLQASSRMS